MVVDQWMNHPITGLLNAHLSKESARLINLAKSKAKVQDQTVFELLRDANYIDELRNKLYGRDAKQYFIELADEQRQQPKF